VKVLSPGQAVFGRITATRPGGCRDYAVVRADELAVKPADLSWNEAAATPLSALTAWQALFYQGSLKKEGIFSEYGEARKANAAKKVFVAGAGSCVGMWAVQFASLAGAAEVVALCSGSKADLMREFGATEIVDYTRTSAAEWASQSPANQADLVIDCVGGSSMGHLWEVVRDGGVFLSICQDPKDVRPEGNTKTLERQDFFIMDSVGSQLAELAPLVGSGKARPLVDSVLPFEKFAEAFEKVEGRRAKGKVVIRISE
jgi:NADPH:quinone reductase-like Zn-dependent oxidoreductase